MPNYIHGLKCASHFRNCLSEMPFEMFRLLDGFKYRKKIKYPFCRTEPIAFLEYFLLF